jgi:hypothetical protein
VANRGEQRGLDLTRPLSLVLVEMDGPRANYAARRCDNFTPLVNVLSTTSTAFSSSCAAPASRRTCVAPCRHGCARS